MSNVTNVGWLNQNELRKYPFAEDASLVATVTPTGVPATLPNYAVLDFLLTLPDDADAPSTNDSLYLSEMRLFSDMVTFLFASRLTAVEGEPALSEEASAAGRVTGVTVMLSQHRPYAGYPLAAGAGNGYDLGRGSVVFGDLSRLFEDGFAQGTYKFTYDTAELSPATIRPGINGVTSIYVPRKSATSELGTSPDELGRALSGHVRLVGDSSINLTYIPAANAIVFSQRTPDPKKGCECDDDAPAIRTINGMPAPTDDGNIWVAGDDCVEIGRAQNNTLTIRNKCTRPCCGCEELQFLSSKLSALRNTLGTLGARSTQLEASLAAADAQITRLMYW